MTVIGDLVGKLRVDDSEFDSGLKRAKSKFEGMGDELGDSASKMGPKISPGAAIAGGAAAAAMGAAFSVGFQNSLTTDAAKKKLEAQLSAMGDSSEQAGDVAGSLYAQAYGASLEEVNESVRSVITSGAMMEGATNEQLESVTAKAISLAQTFGVNVADSVKTVGTMVKTGMVPDAVAGLDLIAVAYGKLGPQADDVLDTFNEYSVQFQKIGIDGPTAFGLVQQAINAGAKDTDLAADAIKEFSIRAVDGSKGAAESFTALGFNAEEMTAKFAAGGPAAAEAFNQVTDALAETQGRADYATIAFGLFGTQSEDLGQALASMDLTTARDGLGELEGAAARVDEKMGEAAQNNIVMMQRKWESFTGTMVSAPGIIGQGSAALMTFGPSAINMAGSLAMIASVSGMSFASIGTGAAAAASTVVAAAATKIGAWIAMAAASTANALIVAAAWLIAIAPIAIVIATIAGLAYLIYKYWDDIIAVTTKAWGDVWNFFKGIWDKIVEVFRAGIDRAIDLIKSFPNKALEAIMKLGEDMLNAGKRVVQKLIDGIMSMIGKVGDAIRSVVSKIRDALPFSPAKWGPLSGAGSPDIAGMKIGQMIAMGLHQSQGEIDKAMVEFTTRLQPQLSLPAIPSGVMEGINIREGVFDGVVEAFRGIRIEISGDGSARLVNTTNLSNQRRSL